MNYTINPETLKYYGRNIVAGAALPATAFYDVANKIANTGNMLLGGDSDIFDTGATDRTMNWAKSGNYVQSRGLPTYYGVQPSQSEPQAQQPKAQHKQAPPALNPSMLSKFSNGMVANRENAKKVIEMGMPGAVAGQEAITKSAPAAIPRMGSGGHGYITDFKGKKLYVDDVKNDISEENRLRNVAINEANERFYNEQKMQESAKQFFKDQQQNQMNFDNSARFFAENPNAPGAAAFRMQIAQGRKIGEQISPDMLAADFMDRYRDSESKRNMQNAQAGHYGALANMQNVTAGQLPRTTDANIGHISTQDKLISSQIQDAAMKRGVTQKALEGDTNALTVMGIPQKNTSDKIISALGDILKTNPDLVNKPDVLNQILQSTISSTREAENAAKQGLVYRQTAPAIPGVKRWSIDPRSDIQERPAQYSYVKP